MKFQIGEREFPFETPDELFRKLEAAARKLDEKLLNVGELEKQRRLIAKALRQFKDFARPKEQ